MRRAYIFAILIAAGFFTFAQVVDLDAAVSRLKTWGSGETLTASDLNAEFNNILNNSEDLAWPATQAKDMDGQSIQMDGDQDTHITSDTDDRLDFSLGGFDGVRFDGTTASSVNGFDLQTQSTGVNPQIEARGEANIGIELQDSNGNELLVLDTVASAVNEFQMTNAATGNPPLLDAQGESDIGMQLRDSNGNEMLILGATASAVNEITITNAATGNDPVLSTSGEANVGLTITPAGTGDITVTTGDLTLSSGDATITSTNAGATADPNLVLDRNSASPAASDIIGVVDFNGRNDNVSPETITYARPGGMIIDPTDGSEDGGFRIWTYVDGTFAGRFDVRQGAFCTNATGADQGVETLNCSAIYDDGNQIHALQDGLETEQATTSGTAVNFTGIRSDARRITITFEGVSLDGTEDLLIQIGDSGGLETTSYIGASVDGGAAASVNSTSGYPILLSGAANAYHGMMVLVLSDATNNTWIETHNGRHQAANIANGGGSKSLSATLDRLTITNTNTGTDSFDAGAVNILVE